VVVEPVEVEVVVAVAVSEDPEELLPVPLVGVPTVEFTLDCVEL
jgi:hypothetical protein